ncbi:MULTISPECIES: DUF6326 family protein [Microbacterium]|uniref:Uncharacterized protein n=1 Tax=Microbacterium saccharophilum TaxID=1213358 RepID=A0A7Z7D2X4_9MICO|nr:MULTISPECIES: DUF6326 family protein [Microbacterium]SFI52876.1 hypothetical protein SAMN04487751_2099 [Microbacterium saccharophilum]
MAKRTNTRKLLDSPPIAAQLKLAAAWTSFVFLYAYVDIFAFYKPGVVDDILAGVVWEFETNGTWAVTVLTLLAIPIFMVLLSIALPAQANRITNLVVAALQVPFAAFNAVGQVGNSWMYFYLLAVALELIVLAFILRTAWTWPRSSASPDDLAAAADVRHRVHG